MLGRVAGLLVVVREQSAQLAQLARSDALTGVPNRRTWDFELSRACETARQRDRPLSVALLDLDHFKAFNDAYGHPAGDRLLKEATAAWSTHLRDGEVLARVGGEEFGVLLPDHDEVAARLRVLDMLANTPQAQTFSAGVARWHPDTEHLVALPLRTRRCTPRSAAGATRCASRRTCLPTCCCRSPASPCSRSSTCAPPRWWASRCSAGSPDSRRWRSSSRRARWAGWPSSRRPRSGSARMVADREVLLFVNVDITSLATPEVRTALSGDLAGVVIEVQEALAHPGGPAPARRRPARPA